ncbi:hypothetical protein Trydic_g7216 [Trypoxylus dichotomus]
MKVSSIYRNQAFGFSFEFSRATDSKDSLKMFATTGESGGPMAVPDICLMVRTIGRSGAPSLCILGRPYNRGGLELRGMRGTLSGKKFPVQALVLDHVLEESGRIIESGSDRKFFRALVSSCVRFERGGLSEMRHLAVSNRMWSTMKLDRERIEDSTAIIPALGILLGDIA